MYRLKEAFVIFWAVLTYKYYYFASVKRTTSDTPAYCYISEPAEKSSLFLEAVSDYAQIVKSNIQEQDERKQPEK